MSLCTRQQVTGAVWDQLLFMSLLNPPLPPPSSVQVLLRVPGRSRTRHAVAFVPLPVPVPAPGGASSGSGASPAACGRPEVRVVELTPEKLLQPYPHLASPGQVQAPTGQALQGSTHTAAADAAHEPPSSASGDGDGEDQEPPFVLASQVEEGAKEVEAETGLAAEGPTLPQPSRPTQAAPARLPAQPPAVPSPGGGGTSAVPSPKPYPSPGGALPPTLCTTPQRRSSPRGGGVGTSSPAVVERLATGSRGGRGGGGGGGGGGGSGSAEGSLPGDPTAAGSRYPQHMGQQQHELRRTHGGCVRAGPGSGRRLRLLSPTRWAYVAGEASSSTRMWKQRIEVLVRGAAGAEAAWGPAGAGAAGVWVPYSVWEQGLGGQGQ